MQCICCGKDTAEVPVGISNLKACVCCVSKHGIPKIAGEVDRLLTEYFLDKPAEPVCGVCKAPVLVSPNGTVPLWCQECEKKRVAYVNAQT